MNVSIKFTHDPCYSVMIYSAMILVITIIFKLLTELQFSTDIQHLYLLLIIKDISTHPAHSYPLPFTRLPGHFQPPVYLEFKTNSKVLVHVCMCTCGGYACVCGYVPVFVYLGVYMELTNFTYVYSKCSILKVISSYILMIYLIA